MKRGLSRRNLLKYTALSGATVAAASCEQKPEKLIPLLVPPNDFEYTPQAAYQYMTTCQECSAGCGLMMTAREGRAQKAEGNPLHPINQGTLCARGQASLQTLYNPERITNPHDRNGKALTWEEAEKLFVDQVKSSEGDVVYLTSAPRGSEASFIDQWLAAVGGGKRVVFETFTNANLRKANELSFGRSDIPMYRFEKAKYLVNFGADFMETWGSVNENTRRFTEMHAYQNNHKNEFVHIGPHVSLTGAKADEWVMIKPGTEGLMALSIAYEVRRIKNSHRYLARFLADYTPDNVAKQIGVTAEQITTIASKFMKNSPSLAVGGGNMVATSNGTATLAAINVLNAVAGNVGETVQFLDQPAPAPYSYQDISQLIQDLNAGKIKTLIIDNVNPAYALPKTSGFVDALDNAEKKPFVISLASTKNETTHQSDLVLPTLTAYESWGDSFPRSGVRSIVQPVMAPVKPFKAKASGDILLSVNSQLGTGQFQGITTYLDYVKGVWREIHQQTNQGDSFDAFWIKTLEQGGLFEESQVSRVSLLRRLTANLKVQVPAFEEVKLPKDTDYVGGWTLLPTPSILMGDGSGANKPWLQETPDPLSQIVWDSWVEINPDTAKKLGIKDRSVIGLRTNYGEITATAVYHFGIHRNAIGIPMGQGHTRSGKAADKYGVNVVQLLPESIDKESGEFAFLSVEVALRTTLQKSYTVNVDGNARQLGRNIAAATTVAKLQKGDHHHGAHHHRPTEFYPDRKETAGYYKPYRWGMTIDLDRCNGCSACVVACYAENNLPVVGKERTALGREMSWIRMERYIEGFGDDFEVRFVPMTCQHCSNAGCETVCPVYATYHNPEGLNVQAYNRCVGTRYCSNNCSYKVRRFNWFNYEFPKPLDQQLNSTITTRSVGVMEKCTFCVHRIKDAQYAAKQLGRDLKDGEVLTACQQTCPTKAITFGNLMDSNSVVSKLAMHGKDEMKKRDRQYEILPELNFQPAITYLKKVNVKAEESHHSDDKAHG